MNGNKDALHEDLFVNVNGLRFHVRKTGSGTPLVMIMGLGAPGEKWKHNYLLLSRYFTCIVPDNRGAGQSDKPEGGHVHQWEYPEPYDSVVLGFLLKHDQR